MIAQSSTRYEEFSSIHNDCELKVDVTFKVQDTWDELAYCAQLFSRLDLTLIKVSHVPDKTISFRLGCKSHSDVSRLEAAINGEDMPERLSFVVTIGRRT